MKKQFTSIIIILSMLIGCAMPEDQQNNASQQKPAATATTTPHETPAATQVDTTHAPSLPTYAVTCDDLTPTIEFYDADSLVMPSDSILLKSGIKVKQDGYQLSFTTDSSVVKELLETVSITKRGKNVTIIYNGQKQQFKGQKLSIDDDNKVTLDGKEIDYVAKASSTETIKIGIPHGSSLKVTGKTGNIVCHTTLSQLDIQAGGYGSVTCDTVLNLLPVNTNDSLLVKVKYTSQIGGDIILRGSGDITLSAITDTIPAAYIFGSGNINLPKNAYVMREKVKGEGEVKMN